MSDRRAEGELLMQACRGDESAFLCIYERHRGCIFRFAYRLLGSAAAAEDITHDCFLSLLQKPHLFNPERASLRTYLCAAARNMAWMQLHRRGIGIEVEEAYGNGTASPQHGPYERLSVSETAEAVQLAVESLPPLQREAIILFEFEELSLSEIAMVARTDVGTIKSRLHRARLRLRILLAHWVPSEEYSIAKEI
jgi:RNA polymerase sigma-70 factor, ECF subfamily